MEDEAELVALRRRVRELEALESVARAARAPIELDDALAALVESAATSLHAEVCALEVASARGARGEIAFRSSPDGPTDEELGGLPALAPHVADGRLAIPLPTRRGAHGALVAWRSRPRARRDARPLRRRGPSPRQEQPPDGRVAPPARRERRRGSPACAARLDRPRA